MSRDYFVTATATYEARIRADSKEEAADIAFALNGAHPFDLTDIHIDVVDPRSRMGKQLLRLDEAERERSGLPRRDEVEEVSPEPVVCPECLHSWSNHDRLLAGAGTMMKPEYNPDGLVDLYQCDVYTGMGTWCGCEERSRQPVRSAPASPADGTGRP